MRYYCTYFDRQYLTRGLALLESIRRHETSRFTLFVVCMDEMTRIILAQLAIPEIFLIPLHEIEQRDEALLKTKRSRSLVEYYWTMTPTIILRILERDRRIDLLTYLDADLFFFSSPQPIFEELGQNSILIHEHRFSPSQAHLGPHNGRFNVGLLSFRRDPQGLQALRWWRERCLEWCYARYEQGKMGDQLYLEDWPTRFKGVAVLEHLGGGVGPWNHDQYDIRASNDGHTLVENAPLIFYHFHSLKQASPDLAIPVSHPHYRLTIPGLTHCFIPYLEALAQAHNRLTQVMPDVRWGFEQSLEVPLQLSLMARYSLAGRLASRTEAYQRVALTNEWDLYCSEQVIDRANSPLPPPAAYKHQSTPGRSQSAEPRSTPVFPKEVPVTAGPSQHELLNSLANTPIARTIRVLCVGGAHRYQERQLFDQLFPHLEHIYLFEPIPELARQLKQFEVTDARVRVFPFALSDHNGAQDFFITNNDGESSSLLRLGKHREIFPHVREVRATRVECRTLDHVIQEAGLLSPDMLLLDVQGAEHQILSSLSPGLKRHIQVLYVEASLEEVYQGARCLDDLEVLLADDYRLVSFAPLSRHSPTHGNALFTNRRLNESRGALARPKAAEGVPLISVIVSSYRAEAFMQECLEDLERQTMSRHMEIIVIDAASPENERAIVSAFQERYKNIIYLRTPTRVGVYPAWNMALKLATGIYVTPFSTNDRLRQDAYEILAGTLDEQPDVALVYGDTYLTRHPHQTFEHHQREGIWQWPEYNYHDLCRRCLVGPHPMWRRSVHQDVGLFDESFVALGDQDFWLRLGASKRLLHIPVATGLYWRSSEGLSNRPEIANPEEARLRARYGRKTAPTSAPAAACFDCSIIIPVWNKRELTEQCLTELAKVTSGISYEVIVVDNHSTDDTAHFLNQLSGDIQIIRNSENLGFAKACNQGARAARGRFLIFLNNDTIPLNNWLAALVTEVTSHPEVGIVGSKLLYEDDTIQHAGVVFSREGLMPYHLYRHFHRDHPAVNQRRTFQSVTAACMLIRREIFETAGGFDEGFQNGLEDVDLCLKVGDKGWQIVYQPLSVLYHLESQTPGRKTYEQANALRFLRRWGQRWWVADEDLYYYEDGYASAYTKDGDQEQLALRSFQHDGEKASWRLVIETERAALRQDIPLVESLLARWDEWPSVADVLIWGAWLCIRTGHSPLSRHFYQKLLRHHDDPTARKALARMALEEGNLVEADSHLGTLLKRFSQDGEGWVLRGILDMQRAQYPDAEQAFQTALAHQGDRRKSIMGLGMARVGLNESAQAWNDFCTVLDEYPDDAEAIHWLLRAGTIGGLWAELSERLQSFVSRNPADLSVRYALAGVLIRSGQIDIAQQVYQTLCTLAPSYEGLEELARALSTQNALAGSALRS
jgi:FkbM family methyltransferase